MAKKLKIVKINPERHTVITPKCRLSFPKLFEPVSYENNPDLPKSYQCDLIFEEDDLSVQGKGKTRATPSLKKAVHNAKVDQWGEDKKKWPNFNYPTFKKGNESTNSEGQIYAGYEDKIFVTAKSGEKFPPRIVNAANEPIEDQSEIYGGCWVRAILIARPYKVGRNEGVRFILKKIMKVEDGERFGGGDDTDFDVSDAEMDEDNWED